MSRPLSTLLNKDGTVTASDIRADQAESAQTSFSDETTTAIVRLGEILRKINARIRAEGYTVKNGKLVKRHGK
jgi:hypothetical protein